MRTITWTWLIQIKPFRNDLFHDFVGAAADALQPCGATRDDTTSTATRRLPTSTASRYRAPGAGRTRVSSLPAELSESPTTSGVLSAVLRCTRSRGVGPLG